ncbi:MAG: DUF3794 domain-containing protein, partial [Clostridiales bacterium]|nr:DUF3794 domain-containing protein [Clostridiales bacterium]
RAMSDKYLTNSFADDGLIELTDDFVLPEHLDDAKKIIRCEGTLRPGGRYISGQEVEYEGEMVYSVLYITDSNSLKNVVYKTKYTKKFSVPNLSENSIMNVFPAVDSVECKLVNPRKMNLRCRVFLHYQVVAEESCSPAFMGDTPDEDMASCETQKNEACFMRTLAAEKRENRVSRDFEMESSAKPIKEIISCSLQMQSAGCHVRTGGMSVRMKAVFDCVYLVKNDDDLEYACASKTFDLENDVNVPELTEEFEGRVCFFVQELSVSLSKDSSGENRVIEIDFTYDIAARLYANDICYPVSDIYSCDFECIAETGLLGTEKYGGCTEGSAEFSETVDAPHVTEILAPRAELRLHGVRFDTTEQRMYADADVLATAVTKGEDGRIAAFERNIPVRIKFRDGYDHSEKSSVQAELPVFEIKLMGEHIQLTGEVQAKIFNFENENKQIVRTVQVMHDSPRDDTNKLPITFYYPEDGEQLWNIAKKYGTTEEIIRSANDITDDSSIGKKVLLIPAKRKKPLFSKVISK